MVHITLFMKKDVKKPEFSSHNCTACWKCVDACPEKAIIRVGFLWHRHAKPLYYRCIGCNRCVAACPHGCFREKD
ncbi:4Fe-4S binding protein [Muribaculum intestinale]|uniref:4Fe-4S binding protein n=2 Tax=Muribaculum intestinale TaxID=1796646 RepID=UPI003C6D5958